MDLLNSTLKVMLLVEYIGEQEELIMAEIKFEIEIKYFLNIIVME